MNLKQFRYVIILAGEGSFSKAAEVLNISQPSLSQYIKKIETQLGVELFERVNNTVKLTDAGRIFVETGRKMLELERQMQNQLLEIAEHKAGTIIVGTTPYRSTTMMPKVAAEFQKRYPGMHLVVDERDTHSLIEAAERGEFDICVLTAPVDERIFATEFITDEEILLAVPKNCSLDKKAARLAISMEDRKYPAVDARVFDEEAFVMITEMQVMQKFLDDLCLDYDLHLKKAAIVKSLEAQIEMVQERVGAAIVPSGIEKSNNFSEKITYYSLVQNLQKRKVVAIYRKEKYLSEVIETLIQIMQGLF